jgi:hypothetical protein
MARIRSIKPEFPQSESMGRVSRDARLAFIQMWTVADDSGRLRGNSRMLASLLFPYDDDAPELIDLWIAELVGEGCIVRYKADGQSYIQICNWSSHQKIDKPSLSKIPPFAEPSRVLAEPSETFPVGEEGKGEERKASEDDTTHDAGASPPAEPKSKKTKAARLPADWMPTDADLAFCKTERQDLAPVDVAARFRDFWTAKAGADAAKLDWSATWRNWVRNERRSASAPPPLTKQDYL